MKKLMILFKFIGITVTYVIITILISLISSIILELLNIPDVSKKPIRTIFTYVIVIYFIWGLYKKIKIVEHISISKLNIRIIIAIILFFTSFPIVYQNIFVWIVDFLSLSPNAIGEIIEKEANEYYTLTKLFLGIISTAIVVPITEELFFRVFTIELLQKEFKLATTIIISSLVFSIVHFAKIQDSIEIFISAIIIGIIYIKTNNAIYCIIAHSIHNGEYLIINYLNSNNIDLFRNDFMVSSNNLEIYSQPLFIIAIILMLISFFYLIKELTKKY